MNAQAILDRLRNRPFEPKPPIVQSPSMRALSDRVKARRERMNRSPLAQDQRAFGIHPSKIEIIEWVADNLSVEFVESPLYYTGEYSIGPAIMFLCSDTDAAKVMLRWSDNMNEEPYPGAFEDCEHDEQPTISELCVDPTEWLINLEIDIFESETRHEWEAA